MACARTQRRPGALVRPNDVSPVVVVVVVERARGSLSLSLFFSLSLSSVSFSLRRTRAYTHTHTHAGTHAHSFSRSPSLLGPSVSKAVPRHPGNRAPRSARGARTAPVQNAKRAERHTPTNLYTFVVNGWPEWCCLSAATVALATA